MKISSDSGHQIQGFAWGQSDVALRNHAFDANHFVLEVGTAIATEFYGKRPVRRYRMGHSNGGRSGLISTQKYPKDFDGVVAMEPAISQQAHQVNLGPTVLRHIFKSRDNWMSPAKIALYAKAEIAASTSDWQSYTFGTSFDAPDSFNHMAVTAAARLVEGNPNANILSHDPTQYQAQYSRLAEMIDGTDPDIAAFADNGGKLLIWYGLSDTCVSLYRTAEYFDSVKQRLGASKVQGFARMVTSPSIGHDLEGVGTEPRSIDLLSAMDAWVEKGAAPDKLVATNFAPGTTTLVAKRPVCEYPKFPRYHGTGDPAKAGSFSCSAT